MPERMVAFLMKQVCFIVDKHQQNNRIFNFSDSNSVNRDDGVYPFFKLQQSLFEAGIQIGTQDRVDPNDADLLLFLDVPPNLDYYPNNVKKYLIILESELIKPENWNHEKHQLFAKVFTWNDKYIDNIKYFKLNFSCLIKSVRPEKALRKKFCCMIAGNKSVDHPKELYSKRIEMIRWFEKNAREDFDLFGMGWNLFQFKGPLFWRALNRLKFLRQLLAEKFVSYKGTVRSKHETLLEYQFSICFENAKDIPGYITEKIFDALFAGCIPVYWGAPNINNFIPANCFINYAEFASPEKLYKFIKGLDLSTISIYQKNIYNFLSSDRVRPFSGEEFAKVLTSEIIKSND